MPRFRTVRTSKRMFDKQPISKADKVAEMSDAMATIGRNIVSYHIEDVVWDGYPIHGTGTLDIWTLSNKEKDALLQLIPQDRLVDALRILDPMRAHNDQS